MRLTQRHFCRALGLAGVGFALPLGAREQTGGPAAATSLPPAAQAAEDAGLAAVQRQDYLLAIQNFEEARKSAPAAPELYYHLGLAEANLPNRELRAICWFSAYLAASPAATNGEAVKAQIAALEARSHASVARLIKPLEEGVGQLPFPDYRWEDVAHLWTANADFASALLAAAHIRDSSTQSRVQGSIATAQANAGDLSGALKTAENIPSTSLKSGTESDIAKVQAEAGDITGALQTTALIQQADAKNTALVAIASSQTAAGNLTGAKETLTAALATTATIENSLLKHSAWSAIAWAQARTGDIAGARATTDLIHDPKAKGAAEAAVLRAQNAAGDKVAAKATLAALTETYKQIHDGNAKISFQRTLALAQAESGDIEGALKSAGLITGFPAKEEIQINIVTALIQAGDIPGAIRTAELIRSEPTKSRCQAAIAAAQARAGNYDGACITVALIRSPEVKTEAGNALAQAQSTPDQVSPASPTTSRAAPIPLQPGVSSVVVSAWLNQLTNGDRFRYSPLNTDLFLDRESYLKNLPPSDDPQKRFEAGRMLAERVASAQTSVERLLHATLY